MKWTLKAAAAFLVLALSAAPAAAQWQVAAHAIPIGRGAGVVGFNSVGAAASGKLLLGQGTSADPAFNTMSGDGAIASTGALTLDSEIHCLAALTSAADKVAYYTGSGTCALADLGSAVRTFFTTSSSANLRALLSDEVGTGAAYFVGGALGTPASGTLTSATGLPISTGVSGLGTGVATALGVNVGTAGAVVVNGGALGTPSSGTLTSATGLPISTGVSGLGTGIATALAVNTGSAGAPALLNGAGGTPSSLTLTNATGLPVAGITASTSTALGVGSIELGNATDTTLSRASAGRLAVEGVNVVTTSSTDTLSNKTLVAPVLGVATATSVNLGGGALSNFIPSTAWTPVLAFNGASVGITYTTQTGSYSEIGPIVVASVNIILSSKGSSTGTATLTGLPDPGALTSQGCAVEFGGNFASLTGQMIADVNSSSIRLFNVTTVASFGQTALADTNFTATTTLRLTCVYLK